MYIVSDMVLFALTLICFYFFVKVIIYGFLTPIAPKFNAFYSLKLIKMKVFCYSKMFLNTSELCCRHFKFFPGKKLL